MGWLLDLVERLTIELVPPVPSSKSMREPPQLAQAMAAPPVLPVPPQKSKVQNESCFSIPSTAMAMAMAMGRVWLAAVAALLECEPAYLLERGFVDHHDLAEQCGMPPRYAARLIRSHPEWKAPPPATSHTNHSTLPAPLRESGTPVTGHICPRHRFCFLNQASGVVRSPIFAESKAQN